VTEQKNCPALLLGDSVPHVMIEPLKSPVS